MVMTKTLELSDALIEQLEQEAQQLNVAPEQLALLKLQRKFDGALPTPITAEPSALSDEQFTQVARGVIRDHREVLERLAR
jgi:hypothetical protein